jgi:hypothetical protein
MNLEAYADALMQLCKSEDLRKAIVQKVAETIDETISIELTCADTIVAKQGQSSSIENGL